MGKSPNLVCLVQRGDTLRHLLTLLWSRPHCPRRPRLPRGKYTPVHPSGVRVLVVSKPKPTTTPKITSVFNLKKKFSFQRVKTSQPLFRETITFLDLKSPTLIFTPLVPSSHVTTVVLYCHRTVVHHTHLFTVFLLDGSPVCIPDSLSVPIYNPFPLCRLSRGFPLAPGRGCRWRRTKRP